MKSRLKVKQVYFLAISLALLGGDPILSCACQADQPPAASVNGNVQYISCSVG